MNWFEVALPDEGDQCSDSDDEAAFTLDFGHGDDELRQRISRRNLVAFERGPRAAEQPLVIFEDARAFHRTPLTAYALPQLQAAGQRPIARIVFHGKSDQGDDLGFPSLCASTVEGHGCADEASRRCAPLNGELPRGLWRAVHAHAQAQCAVAVDASLAAAATPTAAMLSASLDAYVDGAAEIIRSIENT